METFSALLAICAENSPVTGEFLAQSPVMRSFDVFFDLRLINDWVNNSEAGELRCHRAHYDAILMSNCYHQSKYTNVGEKGWSTLVIPLESWGINAINP